MVFTLNPPAIQGLGVASGFSFVLEDRGGHTLDELTRGAQPAPRRGEQEPAARRRAPGGAGGCAAAARA